MQNDQDLVLGLLVSVAYHPLVLRISLTKKCLNAVSVDAHVLFSRCGGIALERNVVTCCCLFTHFNSSETKYRRLSTTTGRPKKLHWVYVTISMQPFKIKRNGFYENVPRDSFYLEWLHR